VSAVLREMGTGLDYPDLEALLLAMSGAVGSGNWLVGRYAGSSWNGSPDPSSDLYFGNGTRVDGALYWQIEADEDNRFVGIADTSKVVLTGGLLNVNETGDIRFVGLQFSESTSFCLRSQDFGQMTIDSCLVTSTTRCFLGWGGDLLVRNSVFRGASAGCIILDNGGQTVLAHNSLFANAGYGIVHFSGTATAVANIGYDAQFSGTFTSSDYNVSGGASGATSAPTAGGHYLHNITDPCTNLAGGIFTIDVTDGAPLIGFGPDLRAHGTLPVVYDFAGQERPAASTVGPSEGDPVTGGDPVDGTAAITDSEDTATGTAAVSTAGAGTSTDGADTVAAAGTVGASGSSSATDAEDQASAAGSLGVQGVGSAADAGDAASGAAGASVSASGAATDAEDTGSGTTSQGVSGSATTTDEGDTVQASAGGEFPPIEGQLSVTDETDSVTGAATAAVGAAAEATDSEDTASGTGLVAVDGSAAIEDAGDAVEANDLPEAPFLLAPPDRFVRFGSSARLQTLTLGQADRLVPMRLTTGA